MANNGPKFVMPVPVVLTGVSKHEAPMKHWHFPDREETVCSRAYDSAQETRPNDATERECPKCLKELGAIEAEARDLREKLARWEGRTVAA